MTGSIPMARCPRCGLLYAVDLGHECAADKVKGGRHAPIRSNARPDRDGRGVGTGAPAEATVSGHDYAIGRSGHDGAATDGGVAPPSEQNGAPYRDVNASGLGDRRGVAVERLDVARYRPGADPLERIGSRELWRVYVDGRTRLTTDRRDEAHGVAALIEEGAGR